MNRLVKKKRTGNAVGEYPTTNTQHPTLNIRQRTLNAERGEGLVDGWIDG